MMKKEKMTGRKRIEEIKQVEVYEREQKKKEKIGKEKWIREE